MTNGAYIRSTLFIVVCFCLYVQAQAQEVDVPNLVGRSLTEARVILRGAKLHMVAPQERMTEFEPGTVFYQFPNGGEQVSEGTTVYLTVATTIRCGS